MHGGAPSLVILKHVLNATAMNSWPADFGKQYTEERLELGAKCWEDGDLQCLQCNKYLGLNRQPISDKMLITSARLSCPVM